VHNRVAVILMPITLCALRVAASHSVRRPIRAALVWWFSTDGITTRQRRADNRPVLDGGV